MQWWRRIRARPAWLFLLLTFPLLPRSVLAGDRTAIMGAFDEEVAPILAQLEGAEVCEVLGIGFTVGRLRGREVVVVESGVGKVNAAMTTALLLVRFHPEEVIFTGVAGSLVDTILPGDIVVGRKTAQHDLVVISEDTVEAFAAKHPATEQRNPIFLPADRELLQLAGLAAADASFERIETSLGERVPRVVEGVILTGDAFVASARKKRQLREDFGAHAVEMEGAAVAQVCYQHDVPCLVVRSMSDSAGATAAEDLERFCRVAARNSARLVLGIVELLQDGD